MLWIGICVVLVHTLIIATYVGPTTPVRTLIGSDTLRSYALPVFDQSWRIFAPTPRRIAVNLEVRAEYIDPASGETVRTGWVDLVEGEDSLIAGNPFPPRISLAARRVANNLNTVMGDLNAAQRELINASYLTTPIADLGTTLVDRTDSSVPTGAVGRYMTYDAAATHLATLYWTAHLGNDVELQHVQYRTGRRSVPTWAPGAPGSIDDASIGWTTYGWRALRVLSEDELALFSSYLRATGALQ
ncbi:DUF5819 family protein [Pseudactinotalea sp.]|uniref:DUF5819 family protein n=1 Tax=Pseudactinotalea sp. TaxID=1926260 RepID=UPI003B3B67C0